MCPANFKGEESLGSASVPLTERFKDVAGHLAKRAPVLVDLGLPLLGRFKGKQGKAHVLMVPLCLQGLINQKVLKGMPKGKPQVFYVRVCLKGKKDTVVFDGIILGLV